MSKLNSSNNFLGAIKKQCKPKVLGGILDGGRDKTISNLFFFLLYPAGEISLYFQFWTLNQK